jgi:hypothetical protein
MPCMLASLSPPLALLSFPRLFLKHYDPACGRMTQQECPDIVHATRAVCICKQGPCGIMPIMASGHAGSSSSAPACDHAFEWCHCTPAIYLCSLAPPPCPDWRSPPLTSSYITSRIPPPKRRTMSYLCGEAHRTEARLWAQLCESFKRGSHSLTEGQRELDLRCAVLMLLLLLITHP